jgi:hypothetical protein
MTTLLAVIGAKNVPLTDCDWVLWSPLRMRSSGLCGPDPRRDNRR